MSGSLLYSVYYTLKPLIPKRLRYMFRSFVARRKLSKIRDVWPILPGSEVRSKDWPGWPDGKQFAFVLTHDVEGGQGLERCRRLAELEMELGFRSSFNFVPEGCYKVPPELHQWLVDNGFEVGVHDHRHDGKLYRSQAGFLEAASSINRYLKEWNAVGFRSGFMFHNLDWLQHLNVQYDASTFDTDPFEPQPTGVGTIFPFWVPGVDGRAGYAELPYTLVQDSTLFFFLREKNIRFWKAKLDWIATHGGMALLNVHPDYLFFPETGQSPRDQYPVSLYREFLEGARDKYMGRYWHALPKEVASCVRSDRQKLPPPKQILKSLHGRTLAQRKVWIDLDNTPHVPFFKPIIRELENRGHEVLLTARDAFQVWQLVQQGGLACRRIGRHYGKNPFKKLIGLMIRSAQLVPLIRRERPHLALSLGARSQMLLANVFGITTVEINDYEHAKWAPFARPTWIFAPDAIPAESFGALSGRVRHYSGIKEDVYAPDFRPDPKLRAELGLKENDIVVTVRPPANEAHYHNPESEQLFLALMRRLSSLPGTRIVLLPRNQAQERSIRTTQPAWFAQGRIIVPLRAVDGLNLIWFSDLVVSGGGTMNREAAALGVPVYSIFRGKMGAVDRRLAEEGRLVLITNKAEIESQIRIQPRDKTWRSDLAARQSLNQILDLLENILKLESSQNRG